MVLTGLRLMTALRAATTDMTRRPEFASRKNQRRIDGIVEQGRFATYLPWPNSHLNLRP